MDDLEKILKRLKDGDTVLYGGKSVLSSPSFLSWYSKVNGMKKEEIISYRWIQELQRMVPSEAYTHS